MNEPVSIGTHREAIEARRLCDEMGHCCRGHSIGIVAAALSGIVSQLPPELQVQFSSNIMERLMNEQLTPEDIAAIPLDADTKTTIEQIVKEHHE